MNKEPIYRWNGQYFGFINNSNFFDANSNYLGWVENDGSVWNKNGEYLGEIVEENYILVRANRMKPMKRMAKRTPMSPMRPMRRMNRMSKMSKMGWNDALDVYQ